MCVREYSGGNGMKYRRLHFQWKIVRLAAIAAAAVVLAAGMLAVVLDGTSAARTVTAPTRLARLGACGGDGIRRAARRPRVGPCDRAKQGHPDGQTARADQGPTAHTATGRANASPHPAAGRGRASSPSSHGDGARDGRGRPQGEGGRHHPRTDRLQLLPGAECHPGKLQFRHQRAEHGQ